MWWGPDLSFTFNAPEEFVRLNCDVHAWMFAYVSAFDHPFFSVNNREGGYRIHDVPPGHYAVVGRTARPVRWKRQLMFKTRT